MLRETVTAIDPHARRVTTDAGVHEADHLVIALGADYDLAATPGLAEHGEEFYSVAGAERLAGIIGSFSQGHAIVGVCGAPFKCPPAPSECALLLHDALTKRGVRDACEISFVIPLPRSVPPSPEASDALETRSRSATSDSSPVGVSPPSSPGSCGSTTVHRMPFDLFLGVPRHRAPDVVIESGMAEDGYIPVESATLKTRFPGVYAVGDVTTAGVPKAGVFAEGAARVVAQQLIAELRGGEQPGRYLGQGSCYVEFGDGRVARVDIDFLSGPKKTGTFKAPSTELAEEKEHFGSSRRARWFAAPAAATLHDGE